MNQTNSSNRSNQSQNMNEKNNLNNNNIQPNSITQTQNNNVNNMNQNQKQENQVQFWYQKQGDKTNNQQIVQQQGFKEQQILQEIQYFVFQDLANFLGMLAEYKIIQEYFQNVNDQTYLQISLNRLILQSNISNGVHFDCDFRYNTQFEKETYLKQKQFAYQLYIDYIKNLQIEQNNKVYECINQYQNTLKSQKVQLNQIEPIKVQQQNQFNQETFQKLFNGMCQVDQTIQQIQQGNYKKLDKNDIERIIQQRQQLTLQKLKEKYPKESNDNQNKQKAPNIFQKIGNTIQNLF